MWQSELDDVQRAHEICLELPSDLIFVLVFACADNAVAGAVGNDIDAPVFLDAFLNRIFYRRSYSHIAKQAMVVFRIDRVEMPILHALWRVFKCSPHCAHQVAMRQRCFCDTPAQMTRRAEDKPYKLLRRMQSARWLCRGRESQL